MYIQYSGATPGRRGPLMRIVGAVLAVALLAVSLLLGAVFLVSTLLALAIVAVFTAHRTRKYRRKGASQTAGRVLEGEWREVDPRYRQSRGADDPLDR